MTRDQLQYIIQVAECGNITHAAEKLHISQPSLSNQIIALEKELGVFLFERSRKRVYLTDAGLAFTTQARQILQNFTILEQMMAEYASQKTGHIRIGALSVMCSLRIPELIHGFNQEHPGIRVSLLESGSAALLKALDANEIDAAFLLSEDITPFQDQYTFHFLSSSSICAAISTRNPLSRQKTVSLEDLSHEPLITTTGNFNLTYMIENAMKKHGLTCHIQSACNQIDSCLSLADKNMGITFCTPETFQYYHHYADLRCLPITPSIDRAVYLSYKKNLDYHPVLHKFVSYSLAFML